MKTKIYLAAVFFIILFSCKDYDCECVNSASKMGSPNPTYVVSHTNMSGRRSKMEKACRNAGDANTTCTLNSK